MNPRPGFFYFYLKIKLAKLKMNPPCVERGLIRLYNSKTRKVAFRDQITPHSAHRRIPRPNNYTKAIRDRQKHRFFVRTIALSDDNIPPSVVNY
jgi:hypothetical protein